MTGFDGMYRCTGPGHTLDPIYADAQLKRDSLFIFEGDFTVEAPGDTHRVRIATAACAHRAHTDGVTPCACQVEADKLTILHTVLGLWALVLEARKRGPSDLHEIVVANRERIFPADIFGRLPELMTAEVWTGTSSAEGMVAQSKTRASRHWGKLNCTSMAAAQAPGSVSSQATRTEEPRATEEAC